MINQFGDLRVVMESLEIHYLLDISENSLRAQQPMLSDIIISEILIVMDFIMLRCSCLDDILLLLSIKMDMLLMGRSTPIWIL